MNNREAKRLACRVISREIREIINVWDFLSDRLGREDVVRVEKAIIELADELERRAGDAEFPPTRKY